MEVILIKSTNDQGLTCTSLYSPEHDGPIEDLIDCEVIYRKDLAVDNDGFICWRSSMDAGSPEPFIGENIKDLLPHKS